MTFLSNLETVGTQMSLSGLFNSTVFWDWYHLLHHFNKFLFTSLLALQLMVYC